MSEADAISALRDAKARRGSNRMAWAAAILRARKLPMTRAAIAVEVGMTVEEVAEAEHSAALLMAHRGITLYAA
jgi:hypothetical protein